MESKIFQINKQIKFDKQILWIPLFVYYESVLVQINLRKEKWFSKLSFGDIDGTLGK